MSISKLTGDTICDIISRIPVKSIAQFKCVCKSWCSLISSPHFVKLHLDRAVNDVSLRRNHVLLSTFPVKSIDCDNVDGLSLSLDFISGINGLYISFAGSCNGLVCGVFGYLKIVVFNPVTKELIELPEPSILSEEYFCYGFGYDSTTDDYKVLRVFNPNNSYYSGLPVLAEIFSMRNNLWRRIDDIHPSSGIHEAGFFLNGALHGLGRTETGHKIVIFDLRTEQFELMSLPNPEVSIHAVSVDVLQGCLAVTINHIEYEIWAMKEYGVEGSWTKVCTILYDENMPGYEDWIVPVCCTKNGEIMMDVDGREIVMYNPQESTFRDININVDWDTFENVVYFETLVLPRTGP